MLTCIIVRAFTTLTLTGIHTPAPIPSELHTLSHSHPLTHRPVMSTQASLPAMSPHFPNPNHALPLTLLPFPATLSPSFLNTHLQTHTHLHTLTNIFTFILMYLQTSHSCAHTLSSWHASTPSHTYLSTHTYSLTHSHTVYCPPPACAHNSHSHTHTHSHIRPHTQTLMLTHTFSASCHEHTPLYAPSQLSSCHISSHLHKHILTFTHMFSDSKACTLALSPPPATLTNTLTFSFCHEYTSTNYTHTLPPFLPVILPSSPLTPSNSHTSIHNPYVIPKAHIFHSHTSL